LHGLTAGGSRILSNPVSGDALGAFLSLSVDREVFCVREYFPGMPEMVGATA
jgi:hypothetical protein